MAAYFPSFCCFSVFAAIKEIGMCNIFLMFHYLLLCKKTFTDIQMIIFYYRNAHYLVYHSKKTRPDGEKITAFLKSATPNQPRSVK